MLNRGVTLRRLDVTEDTQKFLSELERRWRSRTPATRIDEVRASDRVMRGEMRLWASENGVKIDELDDAFQAEVLRVFVRLRREFPDDQWDSYNYATRALAKRFGIVLPRK